MTDYLESGNAALVNFLESKATLIDSLNSVESAIFALENLRNDMRSALGESNNLVSTSSHEKTTKTTPAKPNPKKKTSRTPRKPSSDEVKKVTEKKDDSDEHGFDSKTVEAESRSSDELENKLTTVSDSTMDEDDDWTPGVDAAPLLESETVSETAKSAALATEAVRARADTSAPRTRYQWVGGADGDLFEVEDFENLSTSSDNLDFNDIQY